MVMQEINNNDEINKNLVMALKQELDDGNETRTW